MDSDVPQKLSGLFTAFKSSVKKTKKAEKQPSDHEQWRITSTEIRFQVIKRTGDIEPFDAEKISVAIGKAFSAIENCDRHIRIVIERISREISLSKDRLIKVLNSYFQSDLFSFEGALKLTAASQALSIFKKLKEITLSVIFTTTRNFSIQKNLSISA